MAGEDSYWTARMLGRRVMVRGAASAAGAFALGLVACGSSKPAAPSSGGNVVASPANAVNKPAAATPAAITAATPAGSSGAQVDSTKGIPGGNFLVQSPSSHQNLDLVSTRNTDGYRLAGLTQSGILAYKFGRTGTDGATISVEPEVAQALPEQPDDLTQVYKIRSDVKFHNGRPLTSDDIKYTLERYAFWDNSLLKDSYTWLDRVDASDPQTVIVKTKAPYADAVQSMAPYNDPFILAKEHEEGPDALTSLVGSGPYLWGGDSVPVSSTLKKNPNYFQKPYPYFDQITFFPVTNSAKQVADFISHQVQFPNFYAQQERDQVKQSRPDARLWAWPGAGPTLIPRVDQAPWNDKRVRQALSMSIDRKQIIDLVFKGEGEPDQVLSIINTPWGFRKPGDLPSAQYWNYDPQAAKQLLSAAGIDKPIEKALTYTNGSNQFILDSATLMLAKWKELGVGNFKDNAVASNVFQSTINVGQFTDDLGLNVNGQYILLGTFIRNRYWSPPEGVKAPTPNVGHVNDPQLNALLDKQLTQLKLDDRKATFRQIEEIFGEQQYRITLTTWSYNWFVDPAVKDVDVPANAWQGGANYFKYWWFDKA